jgi:hypothetical protein
LRIFIARDTKDILQNTDLKQGWFKLIAKRFKLNRSDAIRQQSLGHFVKARNILARATFGDANSPDIPDLIDDRGLLVVASRLHFGENVCLKIQQGVTPKLRILNMESYVVKMSQARIMSVSEEWIQKVVQANPSRHQLFIVRKVDCRQRLSLPPKASTVSKRPIEFPQPSNSLLGAPGAGGSRSRQSATP